MVPLSLLLVVVSTTYVQSATSLNAAWFKYKVQFNKSFNGVEEPLRIQIFSDNLARISEHNKLYEEGKVGYKVGVNKFAHLTPMEFRSYMGLHQRPNSVHIPGNVYHAPAGVTELPASIDYRDRGAVNPVKNQGECESCWAFSTIGSLEGIHALKNGTLLSLSEQNLVDCSISYGNSACRGGSLDNAFDYIVDNGIETDTVYPYTAELGNCVYNASQVAVKINNYTQVEKGNETALQAAVANVGPISAGVDASGFQFYESGIYSADGPYVMDHGVVVIGYGADNGQEYWLVRNSWGADWGEQGYIRIARNKNNQVLIADYALYPGL